MSIPFLVDEKPTVVAVGSAGERSGGARKISCGVGDAAGAADELHGRDVWRFAGNCGPQPRAGECGAWFCCQPRRRAARRSRIDRSSRGFGGSAHRQSGGSDHYGPRVREGNRNCPRLEPQQLVAMLLVSGIYDLFAVDRSGARAQFNKSMMWAYSGVKSLSVDERFKLMSVPAHVTAAFPPSYISSGNADPLAPQAVSLVQKLHAISACAPMCCSFRRTMIRRCGMSISSTLMARRGRSR
jgi:acetyl esterase/lipase